MTTEWNAQNDSKAKPNDKIIQGKQKKMPAKQYRT